jgi:hypothetical protein
MDGKLFLENESGSKSYNNVYEDKAFLHRFVKGMNGHTNIIAKSFPKLEIWGKVKTFLDVGGSNG